MNKIIIFLLLFSFTAKAQVIPVIGGVNYERKIRRPEPKKVLQQSTTGGFIINFDGTETAATGDLREMLEPYKTGQTISLIKEPLGVRTGQTFYIEANSTNVILKYTTKQSLENAIYTYLEYLGINWYGAGANWLIKKDILNVPIIAGTWVEPTFRGRNFDGTGGLDFFNNIDPYFLYKTNWYAFKRRNKFNGDFFQPQHVGQEFYVENTALSNAHPEWFNSVSGKQNGRIRVEISAAVQAYKDWYKSKPNTNDSFKTVNVDPEDGRGGIDDPLPPDGFNGIAKWNHADKWWYFANEIAKEYDSTNAKIHIGALSYGDGPTITLVPKFPLKRNVFPVLTPYAFQTAYLPKEMIKVWHANTVGKMGIYDYWNITQWSFGLPQFNIYGIKDKLTFWSKNDINSIQLETTDAGGPMGHTFWISSKLQFDTTKNFDSLYNQYLTDCFGKGKQSMKNMFDRWSLNYQYNQDVNFTLRDLKNASDSVILNGQEYKRLTDLKAYSHYLKIMAQRTFAQSNNDSIYQYLYSIHQRMMVQTAGIVGQRYLGPAPMAITSHQLTDAEVQTNFINDLTELPTQYEISTLVYDYDKANYIDSMPLNAWRFGKFALGQFKAKITGMVSIDMGTQGATKAKIYTQDSVYLNEQIDSTNATFRETIDGQNWFMKNYVINVIAGQTYNVTPFGGFGRLRVRTPGIIIFQKTSPDDFDNYGYPAKYFYVPIGTKKIAYRDVETQPFNGRGYLVPPGGAGLVRTPTLAASIYTVDVPAGTDGKVWTAFFGHTGWSLNNIPNIFTLQKFSYTE